MRHPYEPAHNQRQERFLYCTPGQPVFFTIRAYRDSSPFATPQLADAVIGCLLDQRTASGCDLYAYCLMPNHIHILTGPTTENCSTLKCIDRFRGKSTRVGWEHGWQGKLWQPRSYDRLIRKEENLLAIAEYILCNPVRSGLAEHWEDYAWCGLVDDMPLGQVHSDGHKAPGYGTDSASVA